MPGIDDFLSVKPSKIPPSQGKILVSEPFLPDLFFRRTVVLLAEHGQNGTIGLILNRPIHYKVNDVIKDFPSFSSRVYLGGPVNTNNIYFLHRLGNSIPDSVEILKDIWWGGDMDVLAELIQKGMATPTQVRFYIGYSGWAPKQLERELKEDSWVVTEARADEILSSRAGDLWTKKVASMGKDYEHWANFPIDPAFN